MLTRGHLIFAQWALVENIRDGTPHEYRPTMKVTIHACLVVCQIPSRRSSCRIRNSVEMACTAKSGRRGPHGPLLPDFVEGTLNLILIVPAKLDYHAGISSLTGAAILAQRQAVGGDYLLVQDLFIYCQDGCLLFGDTRFKGFLHGHGPVQKNLGI